MLPLWQMRNSILPHPGRKLVKKPKYYHVGASWNGWDSSRMRCVICEQDFKTGEKRSYITTTGMWRHLDCRPDAAAFTPIGPARPASDPRVLRWKTTQGPTSAAGNLDNMEYRFWIGTRNEQTKFASCRWCRMVTFGPNERTAHNEGPHSHCTSKLVKAYGVLNAKGRCVVCDGSCRSRREWGIPICGDKCMEAWKFNIESLPQLYAAIQEVSGMFSDGRHPVELG